MTDPTLKAMLHALEVLDDTASFRRQIRRDRAWREELPEIDAIDERDAGEFFEEQQAYHGSDRR